MIEASDSPGLAPRHPPRWMLVALLVSTNLLWGASWVVTKIALVDASPIQLGGWRMVLAAAVLAPVLWLGLRRGHIPRGALPMLAGLGFVGFVANRALNYWGVNWSTALNASLLMAVEPLFTLLLAWWWLREPLTRRKMGGLALGIAGAYLIVARGFRWPDFSTLGVMGDLVFLLGLTLEAVYSIWGKIAVRRLSPVMISAGAIVLGTGFWLPAMVVDGTLNGWPTVSWGFMGAMVYLSVGCTVFSYMAWLFVLSHMEAGRAAMSVLLQPLFGAVLAAWLLGEPATVVTWIGGGLVMASLALSLTGGTGAAGRGNILRGDSQ